MPELLEKIETGPLCIKVANTAKAQTGFSSLSQVRENIASEN
jgi:hypothetical protein